MMKSESAYPVFDRSALRLRPLSERTSDLDLSIIRPLEPVSVDIHPRLISTARDMLTARDRGASAILMLGGHVLRAGVQRYLIDMMERGLISCIGVNGAVMIHDFEFALHGKTTESVARYIATGEFGLWRETGRLNELILEAHHHGLGMGEGVGNGILSGDFPHKGISLLAQAARCRVPVTVHVGIGHDIIHEHPNCNGAAVGATSYRDFLIYTEVVRNLEQGVVATFGSQVMAPEVFLKAMAMARNVASSNGRTITRFTSLVCDLRQLPDNLDLEPEKTDPAYYFRPWKTLLTRTTASGGTSYYVALRHEQSIPALWTALAETQA